MRRLTVRSQFGHVAQHCYSPPLAREFLQSLQRGQHRVGIGVIGIIQHAHPFVFPELEPHLRGLALRQSAFDRSAVQTEFRSQGDCEKGIRRLMASQQMNPVLARQVRLRRFYFEDNALPVSAQATDSPIISGEEPNSYHPHIRPRGNPRTPFIVARQEQFSFF